MTVFARLSTLFLVVAAVSPVFAANFPRTQSESDCQSSEFWYEQKTCCLPNGGPSTRPTPPSGSDCPATGWYWHSGEGCCVPTKPTPPSAPAPQCNSGWDWSPNEYRCCQGTKTTSTTAHPSQTPSSNNNGHYKHKRGLKSRAPSLCPSGLEACPISGLTSGEYECIETAYDLNSCGGCASTGLGLDCTAIDGAWNVGCDQGVCKIYTCAAGFKLARDGSSCVSA